MTITSVSKISTPALLLEQQTFERNLHIMANALPGPRLRPHVKAHKSTVLARRQAEVGHTGFTCATSREVIGLAKAGLADEILLANQTVDRNRLRAMAKLDAMVTVAVDSNATVDAAAAAGIKHCVIDVYVGMPRCGIHPDQAGALGERARAAGLQVRGVMGYEGHLMTEHDRATSIIRAMERLQQAHDAVGGDLVSAGGTGTFNLHANTIVNEIQAGSYLVMDRHYGDIGLPFEQALFILGTVISVSSNWAVLDVGLKAHTMEHGNPTVDAGETLYLADEHLVFIPSSPVRVGQRVRVTPSHCDPTIALYDRFYLVDGAEVIDQIPIDLRGW